MLPSNWLVAWDITREICVEAIVDATGCRSGFALRETKRPNNKHGRRGDRRIGKCLRAFVRLCAGVSRECAVWVQLRAGELDKRPGVVERRVAWEVSARSQQ